MMAQAKFKPTDAFVPPRADFEILSRSVYGKPLVYLDSAASAQKPRRVLDAMNEFRDHGIRQRASRRALSFRHGDAAL